MAGIYIHIPFCRQKCYYCDFYKSLKISLLKEYINALTKEACVRNNFFGNELISTIYFGGGTPSVLRPEQLEDILGTIYKYYAVSGNTEITLEANPDDLDINYLVRLHNAGINRLSIGIQSLYDQHLEKMNRRHTAKQARDSVNIAKQAGFKNISVDLIYGFPGLTADQWKSNLREVLSMPVDHLSAYHMTYHQDTVFYKWLKKGIISELPETDSVNQFRILTDEAESAGFEQYEISNFAKNGIYSRHNTSYWTGEKYMGLGPSAHSYNGSQRSWNVSDLEKYIWSVNKNIQFFTEETLTVNNKYNEYILTNLRTKWGVSRVTLNKLFGEKKAAIFTESSEKYIDLKKMYKKNGIYFLTREGIFTSDDIIAGLMII